jgi:hypothetical protein
MASNTPTIAELMKDDKEEESLNADATAASNVPSIEELMKDSDTVDVDSSDEAINAPSIEEMMKDSDTVDVDSADEAINAPSIEELMKDSVKETVEELPTDEVSEREKTPEEIKVPEAAQAYVPIPEPQQVPVPVPVPEREITPEEKAKMTPMERKVLDAAKAYAPPPDPQQVPKYISPIHTVGRMVMGAYGAAGRGLLGVGSMAVGEENTASITDWADKVAEYIPLEVRAGWQNVTNPEHANEWEKMGATIGSYFVLGGPFIKWAGKLGKMISKPKTPLGKTVQMGVTSGIGMAGAATIVEDPTNNIVNIISDHFPDSKEYLEKLRIDPTDEESIQYLKALRNNLMFEGPTTAAAMFLFKGLKYVSEREFIKKITGAYNNSQTKKVISTKLSNMKTAIAHNFSSRYGTDDKVLDMMIRRTEAGKKSLTEADGLSQDLQKVLERDMKTKKVPAKFLETTVNDAINGDKKALLDLSNISPDGAIIAAKMRNNIDELSLYSQKNFFSGELSLSVGKNFGVYINRSYRAFDDPSWKGWSGLDSVTRNRAVTYLMKEQQLPEPRAVELAKWLADGMPEIGKKGAKQNSFGEWIRSVHEAGFGSSAATRKRKNLPSELRELFGEIKDPYKNYARTYEKLSIYKAEADFITEIEKDLVQRGIAKRITGVDAPAQAAKQGLANFNDALEEHIGATVKRGVSSGDFQLPMQGLYVHPSYAKFVREGMDVTMPKIFGMRTWIGAKAISQSLKTVFNPATHARNLGGNMFIMLANGHVPWGRGLKEGLGVSWSRLRGKTNEQLANRVGRLQELNVIDSSVKMSIIRKNISDVIAFDDASVLGAVGKKTGVQKLFDLYQAGDDIPKMITFENTIDDLAKVYPRKSMHELEQLAAERVRDTMPTYNMVPKMFKRMRAWPLGDFISFPTEMIRITKNIAKYAYKDTKEGMKMAAAGRADLKGATSADAKLLAEEKIAGGLALTRMGMRRLAGMSVVATGGHYATQRSANNVGITPESQTALDESGPKWERGTSKVYLSGITRDKNGHLGVDYINLGYTDPFDFMRAFAKETHAALLSGDEPDFDRLGMAAWTHIADTFLGPSMVTEGLINIAQGKGFVDESTPSGKVSELLKVIVDPFKPGFMPYIERLIQFRKHDEEKRGEAVTDYGATMKKGDVDFSSLMGIRKQHRDISAGISQNVRPIIKEVRDADRAFTQAVSNYNQNDPNDILEAYKETQRRKLAAMQDLKGIVEAYGHLGEKTKDNPTGKMTKKDFVMGLFQQGGRKIDMKIMKMIELAIMDKFIPTQPSKNLLRYNAIQSKSPIPWDKINEYRQMLLKKKKTISGEFPDEQQ